ncbi:MAG: hypothetical protein MUO80_04655 [Dehalococcoidia bacterium]|jgi:hypothetical protein|nr:hypothetical protein [Dehalococcoidia bacterium]
MEETEKVRALIGLSLALMGCIFLAEAPYLIIISILAGLTALLALMLLLKEKFPLGLQRHLTGISENLGLLA